MKKTLVTVIVPLYNAQKYISETIQSVINQTYQNWELLVVDDCSTDNSVMIVKKFEEEDKRIKLILSETNFGGPARPRNIGLDNSNGEYIAFLDADDVWLKDKLEKQIVVLEDKDCDIVHTFAYAIDENSCNIGNSNNQKVYNKLKYICSDKTIACLSNFININTVLMKKDLNVKFKEDVHLIALEDLCFWIDNLNVGKKACLIKEKLINYRILTNSASNRGSDKSFRKLFYLHALLLNEKKITINLFFIANFANTFKIIARNIKNKF